MKKIIIALIGILTLSGCHIYQNYERPDVAVSDSLYRPSEWWSADTVSVAGLPWRELFRDTCLQALVAEGLRQNTDLQVARLKVEEAEATLMSSRLAFLPSLSLEPQSGLSSFDGAKPTKTYTVPVTVGWEIDLFGKLRNARKGAEAVLRQSQAYSQAVQTQLLATIADSYYTLLMLDEQYRISEKTSANWADYIRTLKALKKNSTVDETAIAQAEAEKLQVDASMLSLQQQIQSVENALSVLLGRTPGPVRRGRLTEQEFPAELSVGVPLQLLRNRPDIREAEWLLAQAYYTTNEARAAFYPSITLGGTAGWTNNGGGGIVNPGSWLLEAVASLVQPLFNRGTNMARLKISKAQQQEALLQFRQSILDAGSEVNDALTQWQISRSRQTLDREQIASLERALRSTELLMKYGTTNYLEVLTARQSLLQAELTETEDRFAEIQGVISLYHALGGGIQ